MILFAIFAISRGVALIEDHIKLTPKPYDLQRHF